MNRRNTGRNHTHNHTHNTYVNNYSLHLREPGDYLLHFCPPVQENLPRTHFMSTDASNHATAGSHPRTQNGNWMVSPSPPTFHNSSSENETANASYVRELNAQNYVRGVVERPQAQSLSTPVGGNRFGTPVAAVTVAPRASVRFADSDHRPKSN